MSTRQGPLPLLAVRSTPWPSPCSRASRLYLSTRFASGWRGRFSVLGLLFVLLALLPLADAVPVDPSWIPGMYDEGDFDEVAMAVTTAAAVVKGKLLLAGQPPHVAERLTASSEGSTQSVALRAAHGRAPPASTLAVA